MKQIPNRLKVGVPKTLFASYNLSYWQRFLTLSGMEVVFSGESTKETADRGGRLLPHEFCIPIKIFMGHILDLLDKGVDQILLPRMTDRNKTNFFCPKLIGLPEIVKFSLNLEEKRFFSPEVICNGLNPKVVRFPVTAAASLQQMKRVEKQALKYWEETLDNCRKQQITLPEAALKTSLETSRETALKISPETAGRGKLKQPEHHLCVGLLGYAYSLYDPFINKGIQRKLDKLKIRVYTWEMLEPETIETSLRGLKRPIFWNFGRMLLGAGLHFLKDPAIDGIIYVTTFGCGPDSVAAEILNLEAEKHQKPFLLINLDEHTEDGHLFTRLEAFADMLSTFKEDNAV